MSPKQGKRTARAVVFALVLACPALPAWSQAVAYSGSAGYASGDYFFTRRTDSVYLLNGFDLSAGLLSVQASVPLVMQNTPWIAYGPTPMPTGGNQSGEVAQQIRERGQGPGQGGGMGSGTGSGADEETIQLPTESLAFEAGLGDPLVSWSLRVLGGSGQDVQVRLTGGAKVPIADPDDGFATGEWDYSGGISVTSRASERDSVFADFSYWKFGDMPDLQFRNALAYSVAYGRILRAEGWSALVSVYGMTRTLDNSEAPLQLGFGVIRTFENNRSLSFNVGVGLSETVPDFSAAFGWRVGL